MMTTASLDACAHSGRASSGVNRAGEAMDSRTTWPSIAVEVPDDWTSVDTSAIDVDGESVPHIAASPNLEAYQNSWSTPGAEVRALAADQWGVDDVIPTFDC